MPAPPTPAMGPTVAPGVISGNLRLVTSTDEQSFASSLELRTQDSFELLQSTSTNSSGQFLFTGVQPGAYEVWALITNDKRLPTGCGDLLVEKDVLRIGIQFGRDKGLTSENPSVAIAIMLIDNINSPELIATGIFAVSEVHLQPEAGATLAITLFCV